MKTISSFYKRIYKYLPKPVQSRLSKITFALSGKPFVKIPDNPKFPAGEKGGFIISADFELAWAWRYSKLPNPYETALRKAGNARTNFPKLIDLFEKYDFPITWAIVGHLFLDSCTKEDHKEMARIPHFDFHWKFTEGDWYDFDPYSNYKKAPEWYAPDLIKMIIDSKVKHDIGCHTFTHMIMKDEFCPPEVADDELKACVDAAEKWDLKLNSFVFPGGRNGNYKSLAENGIKCYRQNLHYDLIYPEIGEEGMVRLPSSFCIDDEGFGWSNEYSVKRYKKYIDKACQSGTFAHGWFHPSFNERIIYEHLEPLLEYASGLRSEGKLYIATMKDAAELVL